MALDPGAPLEEVDAVVVEAEAMCARNGRVLPAA
jgi:hypothetical protein